MSYMHFLFQPSQHSCVGDIIPLLILHKRKIRAREVSTLPNIPSLCISEPRFNPESKAMLYTTLKCQSL